MIKDIYKKTFKDDLLKATNLAGLEKAYQKIKKENYRPELLGFTPAKKQSIVGLYNFIEKISDYYDEIIVFAIDAISFEYYLKNVNQTIRLDQAEVGILSSTFPSTSTTAWTSILFGSEPSEHGVYGVSFLLPEYKQNYNWIINALNNKGELTSFWQSGIKPKLNLSTKPCLFKKLGQKGFQCFYLDSHGGQNPFPLLGVTKGTRHLELPEILGSLDETFDFLEKNPGNLLDCFLQKTEKLILNQDHKKIIWNYIDIDDYIHLYGYRQLTQSGIWQRLFNFWHSHKRKKRLFLLLSDHGQTRQLDPGINILKTAILNPDLKYNAAGAGRTLYFYPQKGKENKVLKWLKALFGDSAIILEKRDLYRFGLLGKKAIATERIGKFIAIAIRSNFPSPGYRGQREHGSLNEEEMFVPILVFN